jgi:hypothetical protein
MGATLSYSVVHYRKHLGRNIAACGGYSSVLLKLVECLAPPFLVLYVLHTPRGEGDPGRYQSPELELGAIQSFITRFASFFAGDARFDLWIHSPSAKGTIVFDRHNLLYGYGPIECFSRGLASLGFSEGRGLSFPTRTCTTIVKS